MTPADDDFTHDDEHKHDAADGDWMAGEPPVDDFNDPATDTATVSEGEEHIEEAPAATGSEKKKFPILMLIGAIGSLAIAGGLGYMHFSGGHKDEDSSLLDMAANNSAQPVTPHFAEAPASAPAAATAPAAPPALEVAPTTSFSQPATNENVSAKKAAQQPAETTAPVAVAAPTPAPVTAPANKDADEARLAALQTRIDDLQKSLSQTTDQLNQVNEKLAAAQQPVAISTAAPAAAQMDSATQERINKLEQKILQLEQHQETAPPATVTAAPTATAVDKAFPQARVKKTYTSHHASHKSAHKSAAKTAKTAEHEKWVLRAASPDEAWVAKGTESRELRPVHVGDEVAGIGKVTGIKQSGGAWVLQGTTGSIR